ncbi:MAG: tetratricopeptide repeat protein [Sandaracinaceae bacterium]
MGSCRGSAVALLLAGVCIAGCAGGPTREQVMLSQRQYDLGVGLYNENNVAGAFEHLLESVELDPDNAEAHYMLGNLYMINRRDWESAEASFMEALRAHESVPARSGLPADVRNSMGVMYIHAERYEDATRILRESASDLMNRTPAVSWTNLGWAYTRAANYEEALRVLNQATQLAPQLCIAWYRIGAVREARDELEAAEDALTRALEVDNEVCQAQQVAWRLRGEVRARLGHREEAVSDLEECVQVGADTNDGAACRRMLEEGP